MKETMLIGLSDLGEVSKKSTALVRILSGGFE